MSTIRRAVIPAAGLGTRQYPASRCVRKEFFPLVDRDGYAKPVLQIVIEEALAGGVEEICIVGQSDTEGACRRYFAPMPADLQPAFEGKQWAHDLTDQLADIGERLSFVVQAEQAGLGHAVWCARDWVDGEPFLVLLGDHVYLSASDRRCAANLTDAFDGHSVSALTPVGEEQLVGFGAVRGAPREGSPALIRAEGFIEKPAPEVGREQCRVLGQPEGTYLVHFGMHAFTPGILDVLDDMIRLDWREGGEFQLTAAQDALCSREVYDGLIMQGERYDIGTPDGLLAAQRALAGGPESP